MNDYQNTLDELMDLVVGIGKLREVAYVKYSELVSQVLEKKITDEQQLEQIMDGLCDFVMRTVSLSYTEVSAGIFTTNTRNS